jgi:cholesterol oxidase
MQTLDRHIDMRLRRRWFYPFKKILVSQGQKIPTFIPQANEFARKAAQLIGGTPMSMVTEILFNVPGTAHILGGCPWPARPPMAWWTTATASSAIRTCTSATVPCSRPTWA